VGAFSVCCASCGGNSNFTVSGCLLPAISVFICPSAWYTTLFSDGCSEISMDSIVKTFAFSITSAGITWGVIIMPSKESSLVSNSSSKFRISSSPLFSLIISANIFLKLDSAGAFPWLAGFCMASCASCWINCTSPISFNFSPPCIQFFYKIRV